MATISNSIRDFIATKGSDNRVIDLSSVFSGSGLSYTVTSSDPSIAAVSVQDGKLVIDYSDALGHTDLKITATDANGQSVTDNVRVRVAGENAYTIAVLPDTQDYTNAANVGTFKGMTQWLVDNKDSLGIQFVTHVGDITTENGTNHWPYAKEALSILDGKIPYGLTLGNHDGISGNFDSSRINQYFSVEDLKKANGANFGGTYDQEATLSNNTYSTFTAPDGTKWLVLNLEFGAREDVVRWAGEVIEGHLDHRVILTTHSYMTWAGRHDATGAPLYDEGTGYDYGLGNSPEAATDGETMYRELVQKYPNVTFTFSGHIFGDAAETLVSYDQFGNPVYQMMVNYQNGVSSEITSDAGQGSGSAGGNGAIRLVTIDPDNGAVYTSTYFAKLDDYLDSVRGDGELDRDGLTGPYRGHEETITGIELGTPEVPAIAKAGNDQFVKAEAGKEKASVTLDGDWTLNPNKDANLSYVWTDRDGNVLSKEAAPTLQLDAGQHQLTLTVTDSAGRVSTDDVRIVVSNANTLLTDNFNDGNANGWGTGAMGPQYATRSTAELGVAALPGGTGQEIVTAIPKLGQTDGGVLVKLDNVAAGTVAKSYSLIYDINIKPGVASFFSFLQTDLTNKSDEDLALRNGDGTKGSIGINGDYEGTVNYGAWHRIAFTVTDRGNNVLITKYIDGVKIGDTVQSGGNYARYAIDMSKGFLLFADEDGETAAATTSSFLFTDKVLSDGEIASLGGAKAGGITDTKPSANSVQIDFGTPNWSDAFNTGSAKQATFDTSGTGTFLVKGTANSRDTVAENQDALEGRLFEQSDAANKLIVWKDGAAANWSNYAFEATLKTTDNDGIGMVFYHKDAGNHYKLVFDAETNSRALVKVENGTETVLARENGGTPWSRDFQVKVVVADGRISAFLDGHSLFGEVVDAKPLSGGTVGFLSNNQRSSQFDNVSVNKVSLTAHAGDDLKPVDADGDGRVTVDLDAGASYGLGPITSYVWTDAKGQVVARGETAEVVLDAVKQQLTLTVTDASGKTATDMVSVDAVSKARVMLSESFSGNALSGWTIVDEGEFGGAGADGKQSEWELRDGALVQLTDLKSRQLEWNGASNSDPWKKGWSPLGDGVNVLRKGTYALYDKAEAKDWKNYAVEATVKSSDNGALGLLFYYQDAKNYYKLELDANGDYDRNPGNGAGSLFQLIQVKDGVEKYLNQFPAKYTPNQAFQLRVEVKDGKIQAFVDNMALFAYAIEDRAQTKGTVGLFSWDSAGVSFDNVLVSDLSTESVPPPGSDKIVGTDGDDELNGTAGADTILAGAGDDVVQARAGNDTVDGGGGDDTLDGGEGNDILRGGDGDDELIGGAGDDLLQGGSGDDRLVGGAGLDTADYSADTAGVTVDLSSGEAYGDEAGSDELDGIENVIGGSGNDRLTGNATANILLGGAGDDVLKGGAGNDTLDGGAGNDVIEGGDGDDIILVGLGNDTIDGGAGFDTLDLSAATGAVSVDFAGGRVWGDGVGTDSFRNIEKLVFGAGDDTITGGNGNDAFDGGAGNDMLKGGTGNDTLSGNVGDDQIDGGSGDDALFGGIGNDTIKGGSGVDRIEAGDGDDIVDAGSGDDVIIGGAGSDRLDGGSGDDRIEGGVGNDVMTGGSGRDVFVFAAGFGKDVIDDFRLSGASSDILEFSVGLFTDFADAIASAQQSGADTVLTVDAETTLTLKNIDLASLASDDFRFV